MSSFASKTFAHGNYATFRPTYPKDLYSTVLRYHRRPSNLALDLGTGHGLVARSLASHFERVIGSDPSPGMVKQARELSSGISNIEFQQSKAESSPYLRNKEVDLVTAAQAAHWFDYPRLWPEMARVVRPGGTLAFWGYKDHVMVDYPNATRVLDRYAYEQNEHLLGPYWQQPGRSIVQNKLRAVLPPEDEWCDIERIEYEPECRGSTSGQGTRFMAATLTLSAMEEYVRTWSSFHGWQKRWPEQARRENTSDGANGDVINRMMEEILDCEPGLKERVEAIGINNVEVNIEWGSALILARRR